MSEDERSTADALGTAVQQVLAARGQMVTRWVVLVEAIDSDGSRGLWLETPDDMRQWDTFGLLGYAIELEKAKTRYDETGDG